MALISEFHAALEETMENNNNSAAAAAFQLPAAPELVDLFDEDDDLDADPYSDDAVRRTTAYKTLVTKKYVKLEEKREILALFKEIPPASLYDRDLMMEIGHLAIREHDLIRGTGGSKSAQSKNWNQEFVALHLGRLYLIVQRNQEILAERTDRGKRASSRPEAFKRLLAIVEKYGQKYEHDQEVDATKSSRAIATQQENGSRLQDVIPFDPAKRLIEPCPDCGHLFLMPINGQEVNDKNAEKKKEYEEAMQSWEASGRKGAKPKVPTAAFDSSTVLCYCVKQNCLGDPLGTGCIACEEAVRSGMNDGKHNGACVIGCEVCPCVCQLKIKLGKIHQRRMENAMHKLGGVPNDEELYSMDGAQAILHSAYESANLRAGRDDLEEEGATLDVHAAAAADVMTNPILGQPRMQKMFQQVFGPKTKRTKDGFDIDQLRERRRQQSAQSRRLGSVPPYGGVVTQAMQRDSRLYRNGLGKDKAEPPRIPAASQRSPLASVTHVPPPQAAPAEISALESRKKKVRQSLGEAIASGAQQENIDTIKSIHRNIIQPTPTKTAEQLISDAIDLGKDTPQTVDYVKALWPA